VAQGAGKRKGSRKAARKPVQLNASMPLYAAGITFCVIAWGYLVSAAIDFGSSARGGRSEAWLFLSIACLGAAACLFAGLMLGARLLRALGITSAPPPNAPNAAAAPAAPAASAAPPPAEVAPSTYTSLNAGGHRKAHR
jgi:hypothetical protein